jgi:hypothetical protein
MITKQGWFGVDSKAAKAALQIELRETVFPLITSLGFKIVGRDKPNRFPSRYMRNRNGIVDLLEFQWEKYGMPYFIIAFRPMESAKDIARLSENSERNWYWNFGFRASSKKGREDWFGANRIGRMIRKGRWISAAVEGARLRVLEIDSFLRGGEPSPYLLESGFWDELPPSEEFFSPPLRRLKDNR